MADTMTKVERRGRRVMPKVRRRAPPVKAFTLGELVAAAYDAVGGDAQKAQELLNSKEMAQALGRRIVIA
jgi:hypothetical protein